MEIFRGHVVFTEKEKLRIRRWKLVVLFDFVLLGVETAMVVFAMGEMLLS